MSAPHPPADFRAPLREDRGSPLNYGGTMANPRDRADHAAAIWLALLQNNFPNPGTPSNPEGKEINEGFRTALQLQHEAAYPELYPVDPPPPPPPPPGDSHEIDIFSTGPNPCGAIPLPDSWGLRFPAVATPDEGYPCLSRIVGYWPSGNVKWIQVQAGWVQSSGWKLLRVVEGASPGALTLIEEQDLSSVSIGKLSFLGVYPSTDRYHLNSNPTSTVSGGNQPNCMGFGNGGDITASTFGGPVVLRPGEAVSISVTTPNLFFCSTSHYIESQAFGEIGHPTGDHEDFVNICIEQLLNEDEFYSNSIRDRGDHNRDFEGATESTQKFHNNEYGLVMGKLRHAALRMGEPGTGNPTQAVELFKSAIASAKHHCVVDIYHNFTGPLPWMHGAWWPHTNHGASGTGNPHRGTTPNMAHFNIQGCYEAGIVGFSPIVEWGLQHVLDAMLWKAQNGPGMPGIPEYTGEERSPANLLHGLRVRLQKNPNDTATSDAIKLVIERGADARGYIDGSNPTVKVKPWMVALLADELRELELWDFASLDTLSIMENLFEGLWLVDEEIYPRVAYQRNPDETGAFTGAWNFLIADILAEVNPELAQRLYNTASKAPWYPGNQKEWPKLLMAGLLITFGLRYLHHNGE